MGMIPIGSRHIGEGEPCFIIAEAGVNHNGDINLAKRLIDIAKEAGADAVKFQTFAVDEGTSKSAPKADYQVETTGNSESQYEMLKRLELTEGQFQILKEYADRKGIIFISTAPDFKSVDIVEGLGVPAYKNSSANLTNLPLIEYIAKRNKPIILSTGMSSLAEIEEAIDTIREAGNNKIVLLHCISNYPALSEEANLRAMHTLRESFKLPVGYSDHTLGIEVAIAAVALGAVVLEKHFTIDKSLPGPDHKASLEPAELMQLIRAIRNVERAFGDGIKKPTPNEEKIARVTRRSITAGCKILKGTVISRDMLSIKRPETGIKPKFISLVIGRKIKKDIFEDEPITWEDI